MSQQSNTGGVSILGLLGILFIGLKLTGYIDWSWWWVTAPFWGFLALLVLVGVIMLLVIAIKELGPKRRRY